MYHPWIICLIIEECTAENVEKCTFGKSDVSGHEPLTSQPTGDVVTPHVCCYCLSTGPETHISDNVCIFKHTNVIEHVGEYITSI